MTRLAALALLLAPAPAPALTPDELWSQWQAQASAFGATLAAESARAPDGSLALSGWTLALPGQPPEPLPPDAPLQALTLRPVDGGAVLIDLGLPAGATTPLGAAGGLQHENLRILARGAPGAVEYEAAVDALRLVVAVGAEGGQNPGSVSLEVPGLRVRADGQLDAGRRFSWGASAGGWGHAIEVGTPEDGLVGDAAQARGPLSLDFRVTVPEGLALADFEAMEEDEAAIFRLLQRGFGLRYDLAFGGADQTTRVEERSGVHELVRGTGPGRVGLGLEDAAFSLLFEQEGGTVAAASPLLPFGRLDLSYGPVRLDAAMPMGPEAGGFRYLLSAEDVAVGEAAWAWLDPEGRLPRDPLRLVVDLGGRATFDMAATAAAEAAGLPAPPPGVESLEVREVSFEGAGLLVEASGSLLFDDGTGVPVPTGTVEARVEGLDRLIDALVAFGAVTPEQAREARLGLALYFRGAGPDIRETTVEARADGTVLVNGLPVE